jgi:hypothetical protein
LTSDRLISFLVEWDCMNNTTGGDPQGFIACDPAGH